jgi:hypothetical protein
MSRHDLKELGEHLDAGQAGLVVRWSDMQAKIERSMKKARKIEAKQLKADTAEIEAAPSPPRNEAHLAPPPDRCGVVRAARGAARPAGQRNNPRRRRQRPSLARFRCRWYAAAGTGILSGRTVRVPGGCGSAG